MAGPQVQGLILEGRVTPKEAERQCRLCGQDGKQGPPAARQSAPQPSGRNIRPACSGLVPRGCFSDDVLERIPACAVAVLWGMRSGYFMESTQPGADDWGWNATDERIVVYAGGVPLYAGERLVGALGASGGTAEQDEECVTTAARAIGFSVERGS